MIINRVPHVLHSNEENSRQTDDVRLEGSAQEVGVISRNTQCSPLPNIRVHNNDTLLIPVYR